MAKLILSMDNLVLKEIPLDKERVMIGRKPQNDIQIDNLAISGAHAVVVTILHDSFLEDLDSTNGTFVNGQQIKKHFLQNNDVIELGKYRLKYVKELSHQVAQEDFEKTMVLRPDMMRKAVEPTVATAPIVSPVTSAAPVAPVAPAPTAMMPPVNPTPPVTPQPAALEPTPAPAAPAPAATPSELPLGAIQVLTGSNAGKTLDLVKSLTTLGKPGVQVAVIARRPHGYFLTHVEGPRFPQVNGAPIDIQAHSLKDHDIIELAGVKMEFFIRD
ncbi:MAG: FHA domain-containing protein [Pseudomonadota bacterium]